MRNFLLQKEATLKHEEELGACPDRALHKTIGIEV